MEALKKWVNWPMIGAVVFFGILWMLDYPKPSFDDLFQAGAGLHMAQGGDFSNPLIERQEFPSHYFYVYPPLNSYVLAGWLKIFGINAFSVTAYPIICCIAICIATIVILRRHGASIWLQWFVPLGVCFGVIPLALRPEPLAIALGIAGFAMVDSENARKKGWVEWFGFLLMFLGGSAAPRVAMYIIALALYLGYWTWKNASDPRAKLNAIIRWVSAGAAAGLVFLVMIQFRVSEFLMDFDFHAAGRVSKDKVWMIKQYFFGYLGYLQWPIIFLPLVLLIWALWKPKDALSRAALCVGAVAPIAFYMGGIGSGTAWWAFFALLLVSGSLLKTFPRQRAIALQVLIFVLLAVIDRKIAAECVGIATGRIQNDLGENVELVKHPTPEHPILIDGWVARYVYGYRLPEGVLDAEWSVRFPGASPGAYATKDPSPQLRKGDIYVVSYAMRGSLEKYTLLEQTNGPAWKAFGLSQLSFEPHPRRVYVIPSEECKDIRPGAALRMPGT